MEKLVEEFVLQYGTEYDYYINLAKKACDICDKELQARGIKAITSWRAKSPDSLRVKLLKRDKEAKYDSTTSIKNDIADLAGVRIALYFPSEREAVDSLINDVLQVQSKKIFPEESQKPTYKKRFSGYWANHYRVFLKPNSEQPRYLDHIIEIQVASVLMHSWSEIEHDLIYKPNNGKLSQEEYQILDEINGLVLVGEIALERLQETMIARINNKSKFEDSYELKNYLSFYIDNINSKNIGNIKYLNEIMNNMNYNNKKKINKIVSELNYYKDDTIADELIDRIINESMKTDKDIENIIAKVNKKQGNMSGFECFLKLWILLEKINDYINKINKVDSRLGAFKYNIYINAQILNLSEAECLKEYRNIRNELLHGVGMYEDDYLLKNFDGLKEIVKKIIESIKEDDVRSSFWKEYTNIIKKKT